VHGLGQHVTDGGRRRDRVRQNLLALPRPARLLVEEREPAATASRLRREGHGRAGAVGNAAALDQDPTERRGVQPAG
jgi:hypothetical protein